jgi:hypothetical protein
LADHLRNCLCWTVLLVILYPAFDYRAHKVRHRPHEISWIIGEGMTNRRYRPSNALEWVRYQRKHIPSHALRKSINASLDWTLPLLAPRVWGDHIVKCALEHVAVIALRGLSA